MAYGIKYSTAYKRRSGGVTSIDILEKDFVGNPSTLIAAGDPLVIERSGNINNIFEPTKGSSAEINVIVNPLSLIDELFTIDPQKYVVKIYDGSSGTTLNWQGFISTGIYNESYSKSSNTPITIYCNDGMTVLGDIPYKESASGLPYTGFSTVSNVMSKILSKIGIDISTFKTNTNLKITDSSTNPFLYLQINNANYYDEQGEAMSCRQVLDSIFQPLGLTLSLSGKSIYFIDPLNLSDPSTGISYDASGTNASPLALGGYLDISTKQIIYHSTPNNVIDVTQPYNKVEVKYDPYNYGTIKYDFNDANNYYANPSTWYKILLQDSGGNFNYYVNRDVSMVGWTRTPNAKYLGMTTQGSAPTFYLMQTPSPLTSLATYCSSANEKFIYSFGVNVNEDENTDLILSWQTYVNTVNASNPFMSSTDYKYHNGTSYVNYPAATEVDYFYAYSFIRLGGYDYSMSEDVVYGGVPVWNQSTTHPFAYNVIDRDATPLTSSIVNDKWIKTSVLIDLSHTAYRSRIYGDVSICFYPTFYKSSSIPSGAIDYVKNILYKDFTLIAVPKGKSKYFTKFIGYDATDEYSEETLSNEGILTSSTLYDNNTVKVSPLTINLTNGIGPYGLSKGAFSIITNTSTNNGMNNTGFARSDTSLYDSATLLSQSLITQYNVPRYKLSLDLNASTYKLGLEQKLIKDSGHLGNKAFYLVNGKYNDKYENYQCELIECASTRVSIESVL